MDFVYNSEIMNSQDEITISVADLRDLIQAGSLLYGNKEQALEEYNQIVRTILRKNRLPHGAILLTL